MIKICYIVTIPETIRAFFIPQLHFLSNNDFDVTVICNDDPYLKDILGDKIKYIPVNIPRQISIRKMLIAIICLIKIFYKNKYDIIQYSTLGASVCSSIAALIARTKIRNYHVMGFRFVNFCGIKKLFHKIMEIVPCILSTDIECVSVSNLNMAVNEGLFKSQKGTVVFNGSTGGIDLNRFSISKREKYRNEIRTLLKIERKNYVYGFIGRICKDKGIEELLNAFYRISDKSEDFRLLIVGPMDKIDPIDEKLYRESLKNNKILYIGPVKDVERYYCAIDVLILPTYHEGFGNVIIEAAAMGTPAIVTNIPGPIDASEEGNTAIWIKPHSSDDLYNAMHEIQGKEITMKSKCLEFVKNNFDQDKLNIHILERKRKLLKNCR